MSHRAFAGGHWYQGAPSTMSSPEDYRRFAAECLELAGIMNHAEVRKTLMHMAQVWLRLADEKDRANQYVND